MKTPIPVPLAHVVRGDLVESIHRGHLSVTKPDGTLLFSLGDPDFPTYLRSAAKPFQAIPVVEDGCAERYGLSDDELSLMCGSVSGQEFHVAAVRSILAKIGVEEVAMACGVHRPSHRPTAMAMADRGENPLPVHNNCAGKHAAMLALCVHHGWGLEGYTEKDHPVQRHIHRAVASCCNIGEEELGVGIDGCGVPVFRAPLRNVAQGYARLADPEGDPALTAERKDAIKRLMKAATDYPEMVAGDRRICTDAMRAAPGRFFAKTGAEGSYGISLFPRDETPGVGGVFKVEDGSMRALSPVLVEILAKVGALDDAGLEALASYHRPAVKNHRKEVIGCIKPVVDCSGLREALHSESSR